LVSSALLAASSTSLTSDGSIRKIKVPAFEVPFGIGGLPRFFNFVAMGKNIFTVLQLMLELCLRHYILYYSNDNDYVFHPPPSISRPPDGANSIHKYSPPNGAKYHQKYQQFEGHHSVKKNK